MNKVDLYLSLGSNLGDRESNIAQATMALSINFEISDIQSSSYYDSEPLYNLDQPNFLNSVVKCKTSLKPFEVLDVIKKVERMLGRKDRRDKNAPRIIDIDILFHGDAVIETKDLSIPHPMLTMRKFVLVPFDELAPNFKIPHSKIKIKDLISHCPDKTKVFLHQMDTQA